MTHSLSMRALMTNTLTLVASMDVDNPESAEHALDHLDVLISALLEHIKLDDAVVYWEIDPVHPGMVQLRERQGIASRALLSLCEHAAEVEVAIAERREYRAELADELYFSIADACLSLSAISPELGMRTDELRAVA